MTDMFLKLLTLRSGFRNTEMLKLNFLTKNIGKHHIGVREFLFSLSPNILSIAITVFAGNCPG